MSAAQRVVDRFGSQSKLAEVLGTRQSTVNHWVKTGNIPPKWHSKILTAASTAGVAMSAEELVNVAIVQVVSDDTTPHAIARGDLTVGDGGDYAPSIAC